MFLFFFLMLLQLTTPLPLASNSVSRCSWKPVWNVIMKFFTSLKYIKSNTWAWFPVETSLCIQSAVSHESHWLGKEGKGCFVQAQGIHGFKSFCTRNAAVTVVSSFVFKVTRPRPEGAIFSSC